MKMAQQKIEQQEALKSGTFSLKTPDLIFEAPTGQDLRPGILQVIDYPGTFSFQRKAQVRRIELSEIEQKITRNNLIYRVNSAYNNLGYLIAKTRLLETQDSVYQDIIRMNDVRYRVGQISNLEKINGESQYQKIRNNLKVTRAELRNAKYQLNLLMGYPNDTTHVPNDRFRKILRVITETPIDTVYLKQNPLLDYSDKQEGLSRTILRTERSKRVPGVIIGVLNQGTSETPLESRLRFGITLPVWQWTYQSSINAAKSGIEIAQSQKQLTVYELNTEYAKALSEFKQNTESLNYFENVGLREANEIQRSSKESFRLGSVNYYFYLQNLELSFTIRQNHLETLKNYNLSVLRLLYLKGDLLTP